MDTFKFIYNSYGKNAFAFRPSFVFDVLRKAEWVSGTLPRTLLEMVLQNASERKKGNWDFFFPCSLWVPFLKTISFN